ERIPHRGPARLSHSAPDRVPPRPLRARRSEPERHLRAGRGGAGDGVAARRDGVELGRPDQPRQIHGGPAAALRALPGATWWSGGRPAPHAAASAALQVLWTTHLG